MKSRRILIGLALITTGVVLTLAFFRLWIATYPEAGDPKNIAFILWKHGLNNDMNLDIAVSTMTHDAWSEKRVIGLTRTELNARFGFTKTYDQVDSYLQLCDAPNGTEETNTHPAVHDVLFLRNQDYMVRMQNGRAIDLVLCKGY